MTGQHFAQIPVEVMTSDAFRTLPNFAKVLVFAVAAQYRGNNNGDLAMTRATAHLFGVDSQGQLVRSLAMLLDRGLIEKTRQGGKKPLGPTLYAVSWQPIDDLRGKIDSGATTSPTNAWARWSSGPPRDQSTINHRVRRGTASGPPADQISPISGLPADLKPHFNGSAEGLPSRSPR
jgi:hypothetical protein